MDVYGVKEPLRSWDEFVRGRLSHSFPKNEKKRRVLPRAMKNLSYRQLYRFLTKSPRIGSSGRTWMINYEFLLSIRKLGMKRKFTRFLRSTRLEVNKLTITVSATKSLYEISSVAVKVDKASRRSSPPHLNCRMDMRCNPLYTFKRFRLSQSPPSSMSLMKILGSKLKEKRANILFSFGYICRHDFRITEKKANAY